MNDKEKVIKLFKELHIGYDIVDNNIILSTDDIFYKKCENVTGYCGFFAKFVFDKDNKFKEVGIYE